MNMTQTKNLDQVVHDIDSRHALVAFVRLLRNDLKENPEYWENDSLERYLNAMAAWVEDMDGYYQNQNMSMPEVIEWGVFGQILLAARVYE